MKDNREADSGANMELAVQRYNRRGFTLVEIMVAMVITLIVMGGVYQAMVDDTVNQEKGEQMLEMQNNARVVMERIVRDVRRAGFLGCGGTDSTDPVVLSNYTPGDPDPTVMGSAKIGRMTRVEGNPLNWVGSKPILSQIVSGKSPTDTTPVPAVDYLGEALGFSNDAPAGHTIYASGTDALSLVFLSDEWRAYMDTDNDEIDVKNSAGVLVPAYAADDILYVTDCTNYALLQKNNDKASNVRHDTGLNGSTNLKRSYGKDPNPTVARVFKYNISTYFIRIVGGEFNLYLNDWSNPLASNIEDLQFEFLFDTDDDGNLAEEAWQQTLGARTSKEVRAVRIWVLAMSEPDYGYIDNNTYDYPNSPYADDSPGVLALASPRDGEHRHRFLTSAVVYLRNGGLN